MDKQQRLTDQQSHMLIAEQTINGLSVEVFRQALAGAVDVLRTPTLPGD